jgi:glycosyltransferase involved in cell wall biosynthesis
MKTMSDSSLISIGLPVYNGDRYLAETIDSLLNQTYRDFDLVICDNASTDRTELICRDYAARDHRIRYFRNSANVGSANNYRRTLELSRGGYFRWANADDLFAPDSLRRCREILDNKPEVVLTYPKTILIDGTGKELSSFNDNLHLNSSRASARFNEVLNNVDLVNVIYGLIRTSALRKTGLIRSFPGGDIPLVAELSLYGQFWEIPEALFYRRMHANASSQIKSYADLQNFFDPRTKGRPALSRWYTLFAHFASIMRSPMPVIEKLRSIRILLVLNIRTRQWLFNELHSLVYRKSAL